MNYKKIAKDYGVKCHIVKPNDKWCKANGVEMYTNNSCCTKDEIWVGIFDNKEWEMASFFHELGHILMYNYESQPNFWSTELTAWMVGIQKAQRYGYFIAPETFNNFLLPSLNSYIAK